jgi:hypothetical protein
MSARRKLLMIGPPGSGKKMTAAALAGELKLPLLGVRLDGLITKFMGETAAKLRQLFDAITATRGVWLATHTPGLVPFRSSPLAGGYFRLIGHSPH